METALAAPPARCAVRERAPEQECRLRGFVNEPLTPRKGVESPSGLRPRYAVRPLPHREAPCALNSSHREWALQWNRESVL